jgi:aspartate/methionine/tyrosine aminotransferase
MGVRRLAEVPGFGIDRVAAAAGEDPDILRMENLDTDVAPPEAALRATRDAVGEDEANSWLPFTGKADMRRAVSEFVERRSGIRYEPDTEIVITCGEGDGMLDALLSTTDFEDEVVLTDPTYAGMINRVRLAGAVPVLAPLHVEEGEWRMDPDALRDAVTDRTRALFLCNPGMPTGFVMNDVEWEAVADLCRERDLWLIYLAWLEAILFDGRRVVHPSSLPGMRDRVITVGTVSLEQRMIGWRIGWVVSPAELMEDISRVHIYNGLTPGGIAQAGAVAALREPDQDVRDAVAEWQRRRDTVLEVLEGLPTVRPAGGWAALIDARWLGIEPPALSMALLEQKVAATPMGAWGKTVAPRYVRLVYSNEPVDRLRLLGERMRAAIEASR